MNTKKTKRPTKAPRKQTSDRVAKYAGRLLDLCDEGIFSFSPNDADGRSQDVTHMIAAVCGSALVQRERT